MTSRILRWGSFCPAEQALHIAYIDASASRHWQAHAHDFYEVFLVEEGSAMHDMGERTEQLRPGGLHFLRPESVHGFRASGRRFAFTNLAVRADVCGDFLNRHPQALVAWESGSMERNLLLDPAHRARLRAVVEEAAVGGRSEVDAEYLLSGMARVLRASPSAEAKRSLPDWLNQALPELESPEVLREGLPVLYRTCGRGREHVSRTFRQALGYTPTQWLQRERIALSRRLLLTTGMSVLDVCLECGFQSPSHFHRLFVAAENQTPLAFRKAASLVQGAAQR